MPKNCINCGCPISGEGKNKIFCDACLRKISPFLKFISTSKVPAVKIYEANEAKLRSMGLSDMALAYVSKCCTAYDEKKAAAAAPVPPVAPAADAPIKKAESVSEPTPEPKKEDEAAVPLTVPGEPATSATDPKSETDDSEHVGESAPESDDDNIVIPPVIPAAVTSDDSDSDDSDDYEYEDDEAGDGTKRLTLIIIAAVLTLIIFLVLYIGRYIPGYTPGEKDTDPTDSGSVTTDTVSDLTDTNETTLGTDDTDDTDDTDEDTSDDTTETDDTTDDTSDDTTDTTSEVCIHEWVEATCTSATACLLCGDTEGEALGHDYTDATCTKASTCSRCGDEKGNALGHDANDATCTEASVCDRCGKTVKDALGHNYKDATCTSPSTCSRCGDEKGEALGHSYSDATCTTPSTCSRCKATTGEALGHTTGGAKCLRCDKYYVTLTSIGTTVTDSEGLLVTVTGITKSTSGSDTVYTINFTAVNNSVDSVNLGGFKLFYVDESGNYNGVMQELYQPVNPGGESFTGNVTLAVPAGMTPVVLEYFPDEYALSGMSAPHADGQGAFFWKV